MNPDLTALPPVENLLAAALYLATNFAKSGCPHLSYLIMHQLEFVLSHPVESVSPPLRETCERLHEVWAQIHAERTVELRGPDEPEIIDRVH